MRKAELITYLKAFHHVKANELLKILDDNFQNWKLTDEITFLQLVRRLPGIKPKELLTIIERTTDEDERYTIFFKGLCSYVPEKSFEVKESKSSLTEKSVDDTMLNLFSYLDVSGSRSLASCSKFFVGLHNQDVLRRLHETKCNAKALAVALNKIHPSKRLNLCKTLQLFKLDQDKLRVWELICLSGDEIAIDRAICEGMINPGTRGFRQRSPLHHVALSGSCNAVKTVVRKLDIKQPGKMLDDEDLNAAHFAVWAGSLPLVKMFLEDMKFDPDARDKQKKSILHYTAMCNSSSIYEYLVTDRGILTDLRASGDCSIVLFAARCNAIDLLMHIFIKEWFNPAHADIFNKNSLHYAAMGKALRTLLFLFNELKVPVENETKEGLSPLHYAAGTDDIDIIKACIDVLKIPVEQVSKSGITSLHMAAAGNAVQAMKLLIKDYGVSPGVKDSKGNTILHASAACGSVDAMKSAIEEYKIPVDSVNDNQHTILHTAVRRKQLKSVIYARQLSDLHRLHLEQKRDNEGLTVYDYIDANPEAFSVIIPALRMPVERLPELLIEPEVEEEIEVREQKPSSRCVLM